MSTIASILLREDSRAVAERTAARHSHINWHADTLPRLRAQVEALTSTHPPLAHRFVMHDERVPGIQKLQVSAFSNWIYPAFPHAEKRGSASSDKPATLCYSMHPNGSLTVLLSGHSSEWATTGRLSTYIIGSFATSQALAGEAGNRAIRKHLALFLQLATYSLASTRPSRASGRFLERLERHSIRFTRLHRTLDASEKSKHQAEIALGTGLAGGLIASTIFPMIQSFGKDLRDDTQKLEQHCKERHLNNEVISTQACLDRQPNYAVDKYLGDVLSTGMLVSIAILLTLVTALIIKRSSNR